MSSGNKDVTIGDQLGAEHVGVWAAPISLVLNLLLIPLAFIVDSVEGDVMMGLFGFVYLSSMAIGMIGYITVQLGLLTDIPQIRSVQDEWTPKRRYYMPLALFLMPIVGTVYLSKRRKIAQRPLPTVADDGEGGHERPRTVPSDD